MRLGKLHINPSNYFGGVDQQIILPLLRPKFRNSSIEFRISVADPEVLAKAQAKAELQKMNEKQAAANKDKMKIEDVLEGIKEAGQLGIDTRGFSLYQMMNYHRIIVHVQRQARKAANRKKDEAIKKCQIRLLTNVHVHHEHKHRTEDANAANMKQAQMDHESEPGVRHHHHHHFLDEDGNKLEAYYHHDDSVDPPSGFLRMKTERRKSQQCSLCPEYLKLVEACWPPFVDLMGPRTFGKFIERVTQIPE